MTPTRAQSLRWGACFALAFGIHAAGAVALVAKWNESSELAANSPVVMIELAPVAVAPTTVPNDVPPDKVESRAQEPEPEPEKPIEKIELAQAPQPEVTLPPPPPKKVEKPKEKPKKKTVDSAPPAAPQIANRAAAPLPGAASRDSNAVPNWISEVVAKIGRSKHYPDEARARGETGLVAVSFRVDRSGGVHNARVVRSSGSSLLDRDALASLERSQPLPSPPRDVPDAKLNLDLPLRYTLR